MVPMPSIPPNGRTGGRAGLMAGGDCVPGDRPIEQHSTDGRPRGRAGLAAGGDRREAWGL
jgi:hypothetical protein